MTDVLFDLPQSYVKRPPVADPMASADIAALEDLAFLYTATAAGNHSGIHFAASVHDARVWCSSDVSKGILHGTPWAYFWTTASRFLEVYPPPLVLTGLTDNGRWDERLKAVGVRKISLHELATLMPSLGVEVSR